VHGGTIAAPEPEVTVMSLLKTLGAALSALALSGLALADKSPTEDVAGSADHPLIQRFTGSLLVGYHQQDWAARRLPSADGVVKKNSGQFVNPLELEGKVTRLFYLAPLGKSPLEVFRNHQQALKAAGFQPRYVCDSSDPEACAAAYFALDKNQRGRGMGWAKGSLVGAVPGREKSSWSLDMGLSFLEGRMLSGSLKRGGQETHVLLYTSAAANEYTRRAATYIEIVEPKPMETGQVTVDANALGLGLEQEGKATLHGLQFDTGKALIKPESQPQLDQMVALLKAQPALKVFIVGHTDNEGSFDANLTLSQARAQAVVAALGQAGVDPKRLAARGVANLAPVAPNTNAEGRARNRRVELVLQ